MLGLAFRRFTKKKEEKKENMFLPLKELKDVICCKNVNPIPGDHIEIINAVPIFCRTLYVSEMPRRSTFVASFDSILHCPYANTSVFVDPISEGQSIKELNSAIISLDAERMEQETKNRNKARRIARLEGEAEALSDAIDSGDNSMFNVSILVTIFAPSYMELNKRTDDLRYATRGKGIILSSPYKDQQNAFLSNLPLGNNMVGYYHPMDKYSLSTFFPHTKGEFGHSKGAILGRNMDTHQLACYNFFERSMNGYNMVIVGMTRSGKSTTVKILVKRSYYPGGPQFIMLDAEGEYGKLTEELNGQNIVISNYSGTIINPFDLDVEYVIDKLTGREVIKLDLTEKIANVTNNIMTLIRGSEQDTSNKDIVDDAMRRIVQEVVMEAYKRKKIRDGDPESLYEMKNGRRVKKELPTLSYWYSILEENGPDSIRERYCKTSMLERYEYAMMVIKDYCRCCEGTRLYFDGQSTVDLGPDVSVINFDIHHLNEKTERPIAQSIVMEWMWETRCKKNSEDPLKSRQIVTIFDETHYLLPFKEARMALTNYYRRAAKKNVAVITATQNLNDYMLYPDSHAIFTNAATKMVLRSSQKEKPALKELLNLTDAEINCITSANKGEVYVVSGNNKAFIYIDRLPSEIELTETDMSVRQELAMAKLEKAS